MAKWINVATGLVVPADEVQELTPGSGIFVHFNIVQQPSLVATRERGGETTYSASEVGPTKVFDGYAVRIADDATYDPDLDTIQAQAAKSQTALVARGGLT